MSTTTESGKSSAPLPAAEALRAEADEARRKLREQPRPAGKGSVLYQKIRDASADGGSLGADMASLLHRSGYRTDKQIERERRAEERQARYRLEELARRCRERCGVRKRYRNADLDDVAYVADRFPETLDAYTAARDRLAQLVDAPGLLVCHGKNGPGKTHQACALVNRFVSLGRPARYDTAEDFFLELTSTFGAKGRTKRDVVRRYERYELLVIDEYEVRGESKFHEQVLRSLVDARYAEMRSTVLITNLDLEDINARLPRSVRDRIRGTGDVIHYAWGSLRRFGEAR